MGMRFQKICWSVVILLAGVAAILSAQPTGILQGVVTDKKTGEPVAGAAVVVVGTNQGSYTHLDGSFLIEDVPVGTHTVRIDHFKFETAIESRVTVLANSSSPLTIELVRVEPLPLPFEYDKKRGPALGVPDAMIMAGEVQLNDIGAQQSHKGRACIPPISHGRNFPPAHGGNSIVNGEPYDAMFFKNYGVNPFVDTEDDHLSTFAVDVDDASYIMARSYLDRGAMPPHEAIRTEEFVNHFNYHYTPPTDAPFGVILEGATAPFGPANSLLLKIGIKGREIQPENRKDANLVFVVDVSGSMAREDRLGLVRKALRMLVDELTPRDRVGIVVYGSRGQIVLEPTSTEEKSRIVAAIESLQSNGSTNAEEGLRLGYEMAERSFETGKINRVILCSDGVANVGRTGPEDILKQIKRFAEMGITLSAIGFGMGNYNDILMEKLGNKGNGHYAYVDNLSEARRIFVENLTGMLQVIARDVKIQVDFDPEVVRSYRLLGYENRDVEDNKFRDDKEDGGEIGSGHSVTALYEIKLQKESNPIDLGTVFVRYKSPDGKTVAEIDRAISMGQCRALFTTATTELKTAAIAAEFAEILRNSYWARGSKLDDLLAIASTLYVETNSTDLLELMHLISRADGLKQIAEK